MKSKLSRIAAFVMCLLLTLSVAAFALAETTGDAAAATDATQEMSPVAALLTTFLPMVLIVVVFWLFLIRPQRKKDKKIKEMLAALKVGDRVCTIGGIYGTITNIRDENTITLAVGPQDVPVVFARWAIRNVEEITDRPSILLAGLFCAQLHLFWFSARLWIKGVGDMRNRVAAWALALICLLAAGAARAEAVWVREDWQQLTGEYDCGGVRLSVDARAMILPAGATVRLAWIPRRAAGAIPPQAFPNTPFSCAAGIHTPPSARPARCSWRCVRRSNTARTG